jgi:hypothetical protein
MNVSAFRSAAALAAAAVLAACSSYGPGGLRPGQTAAQVEADMGPATGRHPMADGGVRLEFSRGPFGKHTYMVDLDNAGRVQRWEQALTEAKFAQVVPGMHSEELRRLLGRPSDVIGIWRGASVWSWRYETPFCQWFRVTVEPDGTVRDAGYGPDPVCEVNDKDAWP